MDGLFREEAVKASQPSWLGTIRLALPVSHRIWGIAAALIVLALIAWLWFGHYTRRAHVTGRLVPDAGLLRLTAHTACTVAKLDVTQGMHVRAGQPLATLVVDRSSQTMGDTGAIVAAKLRQQEQGLRANIANVKAQTVNKAAAMRAHIGSLAAQMRQVRGQLMLEKQRATTAATLVRQATPLRERGVVSTLEWDEYQAAALSDKAQLKALRRQQLQLRQQQGALRAQLIQLPLNTASEVHKLQGQLAQLDASRARNAMQRGSVLRAPAAGVVSAVLVQPGQAVQSGQVLVTVLPRGSMLQAQLLVPSSAIGFVHRSTRVALHYRAFPYQKFGIQYGWVVQVSRNALDAREVTALLGQQAPPHALYRVKVRLAQQTINAYGEPQRLLPGMAVDADLLLDRRRLIQWIFQPLYAMAKRSEGTSDAY